LGPNLQGVTCWLHATYSYSQDPSALEQLRCTKAICHADVLYETHLGSCTIQAIQGANRRYVDSWRASAEDEEELRHFKKTASETSLKDELCEP